MTKKQTQNDKFKYMLPNEFNYYNKENELEAFKKKCKIFEKITGIETARKTAKELFHIEQDINYIKIDENSMCLIIQSVDLFRLCIENDKEFICYNIISKTKTKK